MKILSRFLKKGSFYLSRSKLSIIACLISESHVLIWLIFVVISLIVTNIAILSFNKYFFFNLVPKPVVITLSPTTQCHFGGFLKIPVEPCPPDRRESRQRRRVKYKCHKQNNSTPLGLGGPRHFNHRLTPVANHCYTPGGVYTG